MKICLVGTELFQADGRMNGETNVMKLTVAFRSFANMPKTRVFFNIFEVKWHNFAHASIVSYKKIVVNYLNLNFKLLTDEEEEAENRFGRRDMSVKVSGTKD
jgi:hypothetical protein